MDVWDDDISWISEGGEECGEWGPKGLSEADYILESIGERLTPDQTGLDRGQNEPTNTMEHFNLYDLWNGRVAHLRFIA